MADTTFIIAEYINKVGAVKFRCFDDFEEYTRDFRQHTDKGWEQIHFSRSDNVCQFLIRGFNYVRNRVLDEHNPPNCGRLFTYGLICGELIDFMRKYDVDWYDIKRDGELYIGLNILANNDKKCILMNPEKGE